jgi:type I site-specific restriction-modification system R (restriction) subunit
VVFEEDERGSVAKKVAGYHQFRAMRQTRAKVLAALKPPAGVNTTTEAGKGGVVWHTQGSGKSLTMLMLAGALIREPAMANPTIVMVTDRNDLDDQLFGTFAGGRALLRQDPVQAESRKHLQELLDRASGGVVFTTIFKFTEEHGIISERANVVVMADEAHRSQYGFVDGGARWMREALPNATFVGFTGTPLDLDDRSDLLRVADHQVAGERSGCRRRRSRVERSGQGSEYGRGAGRIGARAAGGTGGGAGADRSGRGVYRGALGEAPVRDGRQGDGRDHESRNLHGVVRQDRGAPAGMAF